MLPFFRIQDDGGGGGRYCQPVTQEGCDTLQEETPKAPLRPGEEDPEEERAEYNLSQAEAKYGPVRAGQQVKIKEFSVVRSRGRCQGLLPFSIPFFLERIPPQVTAHEPHPLTRSSISFSGEEHVVGRVIKLVFGVYSDGDRKPGGLEMMIAVTLHSH